MPALFPTMRGWRSPVTGAVAETAGASQGDVAAPRVSVIVPVYNGAAFLDKCLSALTASDFSDFEVLVVDDGSTEPIEPVVAGYGYRYMRIDGPGGPARARNRGVAQVHSDWLLFVDADV